VAVALGKAINHRLFDPVTGMYQDRHIPSGRFTGYLTAGCFLPLYAGLAPKQAAVAACRRYLLDPERFYTTLPFAGVDRAHPAFKSGGRLYAVPQYPGALLQSAYWLGRVWLQYSYWLTGALWQAGLKKEADAAADKILDALLPQESLYECYDPLTAMGNGHAEFSWGAAPVLALAYRQYRRQEWLMVDG
jgi:putative isomerase